MSDVHRIEDAHCWHITKIAQAFGLHRDTVRRRLSEAGVVPAGKQGNASTYHLKDVGPALFSESSRALPEDMDPQGLPPKDRKDWYQSENERVKLERELRNLVSVEEATREMSRLAKATASTLDGLADVLERDAGLNPEAVLRVQEITDSLREQMYQSVVSDDDDGE